MNKTILIFVWLIMASFVSEIAYKKGRSKKLWLIYAIFLLPVALMHAFILEDKIRFKEKISCLKK